jgi:hypothetical protein
MTDRLKTNKKINQKLNAREIRLKHPLTESVFTVFVSSGHKIKKIVILFEV